MKALTIIKVLKIFRWPIAVLLLHVVVTFFGLYWHWHKLDNLLHFLGGASIGLMALALIDIFYNAFRKHKSLSEEDSRSSKTASVQVAGLKMNLRFFFQTLFILGLVALFAVLWEFMEFLLDATANTQMQTDITDTMSDLALGLFGGLLVACFCSRKIDRL